MSRITWGTVGEHFFETGVKNGVLYPQNSTGVYQKGVAWNGLTAVNENPSGADPNDLYADDDKYLTLRSKETFGATIEAYTYPDEFMVCDGSAQLAEGITIGQQNRTAFGLCYRTAIGNDTNGTDYGYKLHLIYGATVSPSSKNYATINDNPDAITFSWEVTTTPVPVEGFRPTATVVFDSTKLDAGKMSAVENALYGTVSEEAKLPSIEELLALVQ